MTPKTWTTPEQAELLGVTCPSTRTYPQGGVTAPSGTKLMRPGSANTPNALPSSAMRFKRRKSTYEHGTAGEQTTEDTRAHHKSEIYLKLYYEERIKPRALAECEQRNITTKGGILGVVNKWARRLFKEEDEETKSKVEEERLLEVESLKKASKEAAEAPSGRTAEQYMSAIRDCPSVVGCFLEAIARETGWSFTCILGGPHPEKALELLVTYRLEAPSMCRDRTLGAHLDGSELLSLEDSDDDQKGAAGPSGREKSPLPTTPEMAPASTPVCNDESAPIVSTPTDESLSSYSSGDASQTVSRASTPGTGYGTDMDMPMEPGLGPSYMYGWPQLPYNPVPPQNLAPPYSYGAITGTNWPAFQFSHDPKSSDMAGQQPTPSPLSSFAGMLQGSEDHGDRGEAMT
ncbi:hypothetical protein BD779DRAFT_1680016 [Infundibulicybe gibba]|nr:hypothetical protein BD779DRAFT_1680016 [Infundibulicybe gibba]